MTTVRAFDILLSPHVSEKSNRQAEGHKQFVFRVLPQATKPGIKQAVEDIFKVKVKAVRLLNVAGKTKGLGKRRGRRIGWKKAYVSLCLGYDIDFSAEAKKS